jgi:hypothetical protein
MSAARARLAALATAAGYGPDALALIADAALPEHRLGERLDETSVAHVASAVEVLAQAGHPAAVLGDIVAHYRDRYGELCWREQFWQRQLRTAALRFSHPRFYGLSPCEADLARLAAHSRSPALPAAPLTRAA